MNQINCYACTKKAISREHIPALSFFPEGYRNNLITVPSCKKHNNDNSSDVEYVRNIITTHYNVNQYGLMQFETKTIKSVTRNIRLAKKIFSNTTPIIINNEETAKFEINLNVLKKTFSLLGLALYYHDYNKRFNHRFNIYSASLSFNDKATPLDINNYLDLLKAFESLNYISMPCGNPDIFTYSRYSDSLNNIVYKIKLYGGFIIYIEYVK